MTLLEIFRILLLVLLVICAIGVNVTRRLLPALIIFGLAALAAKASS